MHKAIKIIASITLLLVFLFPSIVKFEHHHEVCKIESAHDGIQFNVLHEKCYVCSFEFSLFSSDLQTSKLREEKPENKYFNNYKWVYFSPLSDYSFLLRAPPYFSEI